MVGKDRLAPFSGAKSVGHPFFHSTAADTLMATAPCLCLRHSVSRGGPSAHRPPAQLPRCSSVQHSAAQHRVEDGSSRFRSTRPLHPPFSAPLIYLFIYCSSFRFVSFVLPITNNKFRRERLFHRPSGEVGYRRSFPIIFAPSQPSIHSPESGRRVRGEGRGVRGEGVTRSERESKKPDMGEVCNRQNRHLAYPAQSFSRNP